MQVPAHRSKFFLYLLLEAFFVTPNRPKPHHLVRVVGGWLFIVAKFPRETFPLSRPKVVPEGLATSFLGRHVGGDLAF